MEIKIVITECDVCGKSEKADYHNLFNHHGWHKFIFKSDWQSGAHNGLTDLDITVCKKCYQGRKGIRYFYNKVMGHT